jgi:hypothetical protein
MPYGQTGDRITKYHEAVDRFDRPVNWFNGRSYRLLDVSCKPDDGKITFSVASATYWGGFDASETLAHEGAHIYRKTSGRKIDGKLRRTLSNPLDFTNRSCPIGFGARAG